MRILIETMDKTTLFFEVEPADSIEKLKLQIENTICIPEYAQRLLYAGHQLQSHCTFDHYNINNETTIHIPHRFRKCEVAHLISTYKPTGEFRIFRDFFLGMGAPIIQSSSTAVDNCDVSSLRHSLEACWLDDLVGDNDQHQQIKDHLRETSELISKWHFFQSTEELRDYLRNNPTVKLITIISDQFGYSLLPTLCEEKAVHSVYIYPINNDQKKETFRNDTKLRGTFDTEDTLHQKLRDDLFHVFWNEGARLAAANCDSEARVYFDEVKRLLFLQ